MFSQLYKDITDGVSGTLSEVFGVGGGKKKNYPKSINGTLAISVTNEAKYDSGDWRKSRGYAFTVVKVNKSDNSSIVAPEWQPFILQINPQEISQDEVFAIQVTPTFRGVVVEHQGVTIKDITISGTTGISPNRGAGGSLADSGNPIFAVGHSGYEEFHELRSYFRMYVEAKRQESKSEPTELRLMFSNYKDNEYLFIEPQKFSMKRSASKPFLYDYTIAVKAIGVATKLKQADRTLFESLDDKLEKCQNYFDLAYKGINGGFSILSRFQRGLTSTILGPIQSINKAIIAVRGGTAENFGKFGITRRFVDDLNREFKNIEANFTDILGKKNDAYNKAIGRVPTIRGNPDRISTYTELSILNAIQAGKKACVILNSSNEIFESNIFQTNAQVLNSFPNSGIKTPSSVSTSTIKGGDNIQTLAMRELGNIDMFKDIIILNNLKPPYISSTGGPNVLKPGDKILIPRMTAPGNSSVAKNVEYNITNGMQQAEKDLGVDIRLTDDGDLAISSTKDLDMVAGVTNFIQVIGIKLLLERMSLKRSPQIGTSLPLGSKLRANGLSDLRREILESLGSDSRVEAIPYMTLSQQGGTIYINMLIKMKEIEQPIPLPLTLNVG